MATLNPPNVGPADHVSARLDHDTMRQLRALSAQQQVSISDLVRAAICAHVGTPVPGPRSTRTLNRLEQTEALTRDGWGIVEACAETGLHPQTWYRHIKQVSNNNLADEVLAIVTEIRRAVA